MFPRLHLTQGNVQADEKDIDFNETFSLDKTADGSAELNDGKVCWVDSRRGFKTLDLYPPAVNTLAGTLYL